MDNRIEYAEGGLKCDNPTCDWKDDTIDRKDYESYINASCPKCGENILTQEDYDNIQLVFKVVDSVNAMSDEEMDNIIKTMGIEVDNPDKMMSMVIDTHKGITIESIEITDKDEESISDDSE